MKLIIAEKPALGKDIALAIKGKGQCQFGDGFISVGEYTVTWAIGHLTELIDPTAGEQWDISVLPIFVSPWQVQPCQQTIKQFNTIKRLLGQCETVIHAGDPDDEGQLIIDEILDYCGNTKPVYRLSTNDNNHSVIRKALHNLKPNTDFIAEGQAAYARSVCDLLFGMNLTRFYTLAQAQKPQSSKSDSSKSQSSGVLSIGRVQTPTLGLVVNRDALIENHIKQVYYELTIIVQGKTGAEIPLKYVMKDSDPVNENGHITNPVFYDGITDAITNTSSTLIITHSQENKSAPLPFNLTKLQTEANKRFGFATAKTLKITQSLRDKHKAITYNRTDCQYLNDEHFNEAPKLIAQIQNNLSKTFATVSTDTKPRCFNSNNVTAHHAIIPTLKELSLSDLSADEAKIYELIATYYLIQFMPPAVIKKTQGNIQFGEHQFSASASEVIQASWQSFIGIKANEETRLLSKIPEGSYPASCVNTVVEIKETKPPARYTEATLTTDMTSVAKYCTNPKIKQILIDKDDGKKGENGSIGTVATRADIIEKLIRRGFIERKKKQIISTELGRQFYNFLPHNVKSIDITAYWWLIQEDIKAGNKTADDLINAVYRTVENVIVQGIESVPTFNIPPSTKKKSTTKKKTAKKTQNTTRSHYAKKQGQ